MKTQEQVAQQVLKTLEEAGYQAYLVGGCVRDQLLHRPVADYDVATNALPHQVESLFPRTIPTGIKHGTVTVLLDEVKIEVTTFRLEGAYVDNRRPEHVDFVDSLFLDLSRRDFTINAIALDRKGQYYDPFHGMKDLARKKVRAVGDPHARFQEDALRLLRAVRFAAQLDFHIEKATFAAITQHAHLLTRIAMERIRTEWDKIMLANVSYGLELLLESGLYPCIFFRVADVPDKQVVSSATCIRNLPESLSVRYAALCFRVGIGEQDACRWMRLLRHGNKQIRETLSILQALRLAREGKESPFTWDDVEWRKYLYHVGRNAAECAAQILATCEPEGIFKRVEPLFHSRIYMQPIWSIRDLAIDGNDLLREFPELYHQNGRCIGEILHHLVQRVLQDPGINVPESLLHETRRYLQER